MALHHSVRERLDGTFIRVFDPAREYLSTQFYHPEAAYLSSPNAVAIAVKRSHKNIHGLWPEMLWLYPEEVRLLASIALSVPEGCGALQFAPSGESVRLPVDRKISLNEPEEGPYLRMEAEALAARLYAGQLPYRLRDADDLGDADRLSLFEGIDPNDQLLIRGLHCLLKSQHLNSTFLFGEDAFINVQIAREAALEKIREHLVEAGQTLATFDDAHKYLADNFLFGDALAGYFREQHEQWVATRHPKSRFGATWAAPIHADDFYETYSALISVYRHLIIREPGRASTCL